MLSMLFCGILCGMAYDCIRFFRFLLGVSSGTDFGKKHFRTFRFFRTHTLAAAICVGVGDVCFFLFASVAFCVWLYVFGNGIFRWFYLLCAVVAFLIHRKCLGHLIELFLEVLSVVFLNILQSVVRVLSLPLRWAWKIIAKGVRVLYVRCLFPWLQKERLYRRRRYTEKIRQEIPAIVHFP